MGFMSAKTRSSISCPKFIILKDKAYVKLVFTHGGEVFHNDKSKRQGLFLALRARIVILQATRRIHFRSMILNQRMVIRGELE